MDELIQGVSLQPVERALSTSAFVGRRLAVRWPAHWLQVWHAILLAAITCLPLVTLAPFIGGPLMGDEGVYATIAKAILRGGLPYRDAFDITPPITYLWYAFGFLALGDGVWVPRLLLALALSASTLLIFFQSYLLFSKRTAFAAALAFAASTAFVEVSIFATDEYFVLLPTIASYTAFTLGVQRNSRAYFLLAGVSSGVALATNQSSVIHLLCLLYLSGRLIQGNRFKAFGFLCVGVGITLSAVVLPYLITGSFGDLWYGAVIYPLLYGGNSTTSERLVYGAASALRFTLVAGPLLLLAGLGAMHLQRQRNENSAALVLAWVLASVIAVSITGRFHTYYWVGLFPASALLAGVALSNERTVTQNRLGKVALAGGLVVAFFFSFTLNLSMYMQSSPQGKLLAWAQPQHQIREVQSRGVAEYLARNTKPGDSIYNLGRQAELYLYSKRVPASRFFHQWPLYTDSENIDKMLSDLQRNLPVYIIDTQWPEYLEGLTPTYIWQIGDFITENYEREARIYFDSDILQMYQTITQNNRNGTKPTFYGDLYRLKTKQNNPVQSIAEVLK